MTELAAEILARVMNVPVSNVAIPEGRRSLDEEKVDELVASIAMAGLLNPITVTKDLRLVAGLHRLRAYEKLGRTQIPAVVVDLDELQLELAEIDENLIRNELTTLERGEQMVRRKKVYLQLYPETKQGGAPGAGRGKKAHKDDTVSSFTADTAAKAGFSGRTVQRNVQIGSLPERVRSALRGTAAADDTTGLLKLARLKDVDKQLKVACLVKTGKAKAIGDALRTLRLSDRHKRNAEIVKGNRELPVGERKYSVIYADPPWKYEHPISTSREIEEKYPTMFLDDLCELPVEALAQDDAILFLWCPAPLVEQGLEVMKRWGFTYRTMIIWDKDTTGLGQWVRQQAEFLLIGIYGAPPTPMPEDRPGSVIRLKHGKHSVKPEVFRKTIERMYPESARIELFARTEHPEWDSWGNEVAA